VQTILRDRYFLKIEFKDIIINSCFSYNIIPIKLDQFVKTFDLKIDGIEGKQFFPYKYNKV
jgi:hypothetical protein